MLWIAYTPKPVAAEPEYSESRNARELISVRLRAVSRIPKTNFSLLKAFIPRSEIKLCSQFILLALTFLISFTVGCCDKEVSNSAVTRSNNELQEPQRIANETLRATKEAIRDLEALNANAISTDQMFDLVGEITTKHAETCATLLDQMNSLESRSRFMESAEGKGFLEQMNAEIKLLKSLVFQLNKGTSFESRHLGNAYGSDDFSKIRSTFDKETARSISDAKKHISAKHEFVRSYFLGVRNITTSQRDELIFMMDELHKRALNGNTVAASTINDALDDVLKNYPTDLPQAQYNLGFLYAELDQTIVATKWLEKAAAQGLPEAEVKLNELKKR